MPTTPRPDFTTDPRVSDEALKRHDLWAKAGDCVAELDELLTRLKVAGELREKFTRVYNLVCEAAVEAEDECIAERDAEPDDWRGDVAWEMRKDGAL